jgi:hypothetical protein
VALKGLVEIDTSEKTLNIRNFELTSPHVSIRKGGLSKSERNGLTSIQARMGFECDLGEVRRLASNRLPEKLELGGRTSNDITFSGSFPAGRPGELLAAMDVRAARAFAVSSLRYMGLEMGPVDLPLEAAGGVLRIGPFSAPAGSGAVAFDGSIDFNSQPPVLELSKPVEIARDVPVNVQLSDMIARVNPLLGGQTRLGGRLDFACTEMTVPLGAGQLDEIRMAGTFAVEDMRVEPKGLAGVIMRFTGQGSQVDGQILPTDISMRSGVLNYDQTMELDLGPYRTSFDGKIYFQEGPNGAVTSRPDMEVTLPVVVEPGSSRPRVITRDEEVTGRPVKVPLQSMEAGVLARDVAAAMGRQMLLGPLLQGSEEEVLGETLDRALEDLQDIFK